jgi:small subunit ribosomal protein S15
MDTKKMQKLTKAEIYKTIETLSKKGEPKAIIGLRLKEQKAYTKKESGKRISQVQEELGLTNNKLPDDLIDLIKKAVKLLKHKESNKKDMTSKRGYQLTVAKINKLRNYYISKNKIPKDWRYSDKTAKLLVK